MENLDNLQRALDTWEHNVATVEKATEGVQLKLNAVWSKDLREELRRSEQEEVRKEALGQYGSAIRDIRTGAEEIRADIERFYSRDAVLARSVLTPGETFNANMGAEVGLRQRLAEAGDAELLTWADQAVAGRNHRMAAMVKAEASRRNHDKNLRTTVLTRFTALPDPPDVQRGLELAERADLIAQRAEWSRSKLEAMAGGLDAEPPVSTAERLTKKAAEIRGRVFGNK